MLVSEFIFGLSGIIAGLVIGTFTGMKFLTSKKKEVQGNIISEKGFLSLEVGIDWFYPTLIVSAAKAGDLGVGVEVELSELIGNGDNVVIAYGNMINVSAKIKDHVRVKVIDKASVNGILMLSGKIV